MPLYEYSCETCGATFERLRRMAEADDPIECPDCTSGTVVRLLSAPSVSCGGSGNMGCGSGGSRFS